MSNSSLISYSQISPNRNSPRTEPISKITIHHMAGNLTLQSFGAMVVKTSRQMSANYAIDSQGNIGLFCPESDRSWCSSSPWNDHRAVTIEVANDGGEPDWHVSDAAIASLINLCVDICKRNGMTKLEYTGTKDGSLTTHRMFAATLCPGPYLLSKIPDIAQQVTAQLQNQETDAQQYFIDVMVGKCRERCTAAGILPSLCIAQACVESAYGTSELAVNANNLFGIKWSVSFAGCPEVEGSSEWGTSEEVAGESVQTTARFTRFRSHRDCIVFRSRVLLQNERYAGNAIIREAIAERDSDLMAEGLKDAGYATDSAYVEKLKAAMDQWGLRALDGMTVADLEDGGLGAGSIVAAARTQLGVPYVWGGTTPGVGLDCSGLTQWCYAQAGISIPRTAIAQMTGGEVVPLSSAVPGDILWRPGHVAIYTGGDSYIHAPKPGDVVREATGISYFTCAVRYR